MARMLPPQVYEYTKSPGEREIFTDLRDDPDTTVWTALHSLNVANHRAHISGEADFVILVPGKGVLCLEVKAARRVRCKNGLWYYGSSDIGERRSPFQQAEDAMHSIRRWVLSKRPSLGKVPFFSAVLFPYVELDVDSGEWHEWQVIDCRTYKIMPLSAIIVATLDRSRQWLATRSAKWFNPNELHPSKAQCDDLANLLRPEFEFFEPPAIRSRQREDELKYFTQEQFGALDAMQTNQRVLFSGPAGTGKTMLAVEAARRSALAGTRVLLLCFNRLLGNWLQGQCAPYSPAIAAHTIHGHMLSVAQCSVPTAADSDFWNVELPERAIKAWKERMSAQHQYDVLVVDEVQDITSSACGDYLDHILSNGLRNGCWRLFGDFESQRLYTEPANQIAFRTHIAGYPEYSLRVNCRNPLRIAELVHTLGGLRPPYSAVRRPDNMVEPEIRIYSSRTEQISFLEQSLGRLLAEGYKPEDIIILSPNSDASCAAKGLGREWIRVLAPLQSAAQAGFVRYGTIHSFKGLEAPAVIVTDVEHTKSSTGRALLYVAITRALDRLTIMGNQQARTELLDAIASDAPLHGG